MGPVWGQYGFGTVPVDAPQVGPPTNFLPLAPEASATETSRQAVAGSFTDIHVAPPGFEDLAPYMIGVIELDEGVRMMTPLQNVTMDDAALGMRMRICWQKLSDDITFPAFEPDR